MSDNRTMVRWTLGLLALAFLGVAIAQSGRSYSAGHAWWNAGDGGILPWEEAYDNPDGLVSIFNKGGAVHTAGHPFFEQLGSNGRACVTCHQPSNAMSLSSASLRERWTETQGKDPVFASIDGANCPDLPQAAPDSHSLLLERGLFRIFLAWPPKTAAGTAIEPEFRIEVLRDPTGCNTSPVFGLKGANPSISVYRRPRVAANLEYVIAGPAGVLLMADGREASLRSQATTAAMIHEQAGTPPSPAQLRDIIEFETRIYAAQSADIRGGRLNETGGPPALGPQNLADGKVVHSALSSFEVWRKPQGAQDLGLQREFRASVARGSDVFFTRKFQVRGDAATCAKCHNPGETRWMDIGTTNSEVAQGSPQLPLFRITCDVNASPHPLLGRICYTQDPGRALISGKCADVGAIVLQQLRGLAARAPYFSNGSARTLRDVVDFHDDRFHIGYSPQEKQDLVNFLSVL